MNILVTGGAGFIGSHVVEHHWFIKNALVGETFNIGHDEPVGINQLAHLVKKLSKSQSEINHISYREVYKEDFEDCMFRRPDLSKLCRHVKYKNKWALGKMLLDLIKNHQ